MKNGWSLREDLDTTNGGAVINGDGILPKRKVIKGEQSDVPEDEDEEKPVMPFDKESLPTQDSPKVKGTPTETPKYVDPDNPRTQKPDEEPYRRFFGNRETEVAKGVRCPACSKQMLKDTFKNGFGLRCSKCQHTIASNQEFWKRAVVEAYRRIVYNYTEVM